MRRILETVFYLTIVLGVNFIYTIPFAYISADHQNVWFIQNDFILNSIYKAVLTKKREITKKSYFSDGFEI